jgi:serine/threonine-protein kinase RsbW
MKKEVIKLEVPSKPGYIGVVRLTTSAIANNVGLNIEEIDDVKVSIAEACINAIEKKENLYISYEILGDKLIIEVEDVVENVEESEKELGILIIKSLMDDVEFSNKGIRMIKYVEDGNK